MTKTNYTEANPVILDYSQLLGQEDLANQIEEAFGFNGLGLLLVRGIPGYTDLRQNLLPLSYQFAHLPEEVKERYVHAESYYSVGWSHGKEMMSKGVPDFSKGSYYNNPIEDKPFDDEELIRKHPTFCQPNIWPEEELPQLSVAFKGLGQKIVEVGGKLAGHLDKFVAKEHNGFSRIADVVTRSRTIKARLLYYFPRSEEDINNPKGDWCGWHNDHCTLTGLTSAMYFDEEGNQIKNPDPDAGLFIKTRSGVLKRVQIPADHLAFQIGETSQIHSGGTLIATPHAVIAPNVTKLSRGTLAVFMEPMWDYPMNQPEGKQKEDVLKGSVNLPQGVPELAKRWEGAMDFGQFTEATFSSYY